MSRYAFDIFVHVIGRSAVFVGTEAYFSQSSQCAGPPNPTRCSRSRQPAGHSKNGLERISVIDVIVIVEF